MKEATQKQIEDFNKRFDKFCKECLAEGYLPMPTLGRNARSLYAYINVVGVSKKEAKDILKIK